MTDRVLLIQKELEMIDNVDQRIDELEQEATTAVEAQQLKGYIRLRNYHLMVAANPDLLVNI